MDVDKKRSTMKDSAASQFGLCHLIWMLFSRGLNKKINRIYDRVLRLTHNDESSSFEELLNKGNSVTIHHIDKKSFRNRNM